MARPRAAAALGVDPGPAPPEPDEPRAETIDDGDQGAPSLADAALERAAEWETEVVGDLLVIPFLPLWYAARRGGAPPRCFIPDDVERDSMARPLTRMLNRSERLRRMALIGDPLAFALAVASFVREEAHELDEWRDQHDGGRRDEPGPDADLPPDLGVRPAAANGRDRADSGANVRSWRPPVIEPEQGTA